MRFILVIPAAVFLLIHALSGATAPGLFSTSNMLMLVLPSFGFVYAFLTFDRVSQAAR
jgi:hypothetical protein